MCEKNNDYCDFKVTADIILVNGGEYKDVEVVDEDYKGIHIIEDGKKKLLYYEMISDISYTLH